MTGQDDLRRYLGMVGRLSAVCMPLVGLSTQDDVRDAAFSGPPRSAAAILAAIEPVDGPAASGDPVVRPTDSYAVAAAALLARIADALAYLHRAGSSHGDLKPSNVVLGAGGHPYLIDFNLSQSGDLPAGSVGGTLPYMAPEQLAVLAGRGGPTDPAKADVYAFGVVAFELLTGCLPSSSPPGADPPAAAAELLARPPVDADRLLPRATPPALGRLVVRCLAPDAPSRPTGAELSAALATIVASGRGHARRSRRRARTIAVFAVVFGAAGAAGGIGGWPSLSTTREPLSAATLAAREPVTAEEFVARGRQYVRAEKLTPAMSDFLSALDLRRDRTALANAAYCACLSQQPDAAIQLGREAVAAGETSAAVYNNLGYAYRKGGRPRLALPPLEEAVRRDPSLRAARYNRAMARHEAAIERGEPGADPGAVADMEAALGGGRETAQLYHDAARVFAARAAYDPALRAKAVRCLGEAVRLGKDPAGFSRSPFFSAIAEDPDFQRVMRTVPGPPQQPVNLLVVDPGAP